MSTTSITPTTAAEPFSGIPYELRWNKFVDILHAHVGDMRAKRMLQDPEVNGRFRAFDIALEVAFDSFHSFWLNFEKHPEHLRVVAVPTPALFREGYSRACRDMEAIYKAVHETDPRKDLAAALAEHLIISK